MDVLKPDAVLNDKVDWDVEHKDEWGV